MVAAFVSSPQKSVETSLDAARTSARATGWVGNDSCHLVME